MNTKKTLLLIVLGASVVISLANSSLEAAAQNVLDVPDSAADQRVEALRERCKAALAQTSGELRLAGLNEKVEVLRDRWGVPHIYAQNPDDLFFAQGFVQAQDRLWQMEIWRRTTEGKLAEIVGPDAVERDRFARLIRYRGDVDAEWTSYSPDARQIIEAFVRGVNAFIELARDNPPIEFQLTGVKPETWTPEVCLGRMAGFIMCRNASNEVLRAQLVRELGAEQAAKLLPIDPIHEIRVPDGLGLDGIDQRIVAGINTTTAAIRVPPANQTTSTYRRPHSPREDHPAERDAYDSDSSDIGSNNWTISGRLTATGKPILASDPHRPVVLPSLRYLVHLNCPPRGTDRGWNVIGGTEPALPGIALGHNDRVAWGMTIVGTDQMDIYVEETHTNDPTHYRVGDEWQPMRIEREQIRVRGEPEPREVELKLTRHGPVIFEDRERHRAYALRWTGSEPGTAGYLAALSVDRVQDWPEFLDAATRWKIPGLNLVYADRDGHIGWIAAALTPVRRNWDGLLPVPGATGKYEWDGFLPTTELPQRFDPPEGYIATANHNILPPGYNHQISYEWAAPFRFQRIDEVLCAYTSKPTLLHEKPKRFTVAASAELQHDALSIPARRLLDVLRDVSVSDPSLKPIADLLSHWHPVLSRDSAAAALYAVWQSKLGERVLKPRVPDKLWPSYSGRLPLQAALDLIERPDSAFGPDPRAARDTLLIDTLRDAVSDLQKRLGPDPTAWQWGKLHQAHLGHMLATEKAEGGGQRAEGGKEEVERRALRAEGQKEQSSERAAIDAVFNLPPVTRDGDGNTPLAAGGPRSGVFDQTTGASYRHIIDLADWDRSVASSTPGQSGQPTSPHYGDLLPLWAEGKYFPLPFSRPAVEAALSQKLVLAPDDTRARQSRWIITYPTLAKDEYAQMLDSLGVELGYLQVDRQTMQYLGQLAGEGKKYTGDVEREDRMFWYWLGQNRIKQFDEEILYKHGFKPTSDVVHLYPTELQEKLGRLEREYLRRQLNHSDVTRVARTNFKIIRAKPTGWDIEVTGVALK